MDRLEQIKNEVARENGYNDWEDRGNYTIKFAEHDATWEDVARRYATAVAEDVRKRAATRAKILDVVTGNSFTELRYKSVGLRIDKQSILSTPINLEL